MNMLKTEVYICIKSAFKNQKRGHPTLFTREIIRQIVKVIKVLRVRCAPVTSIARGIVMAHDHSSP